MPRQQGPFDWQGRLEHEGSVTFGPGRWSSGLLFAVAILALLGFATAIVTDGPALWSVFGFLVLAACALVTGRAALLGAAQLTVTHDGFGMGHQPAISFDRLVAVGVSRRNLTLHYVPPGREPARHPARMLVTLPRFGAFHPDDLAVWLLKLKGGPSAEVLVEDSTGLSRVLRLRD